MNYRQGQKERLAFPQRPGSYIKAEASFTLQCNSRNHKHCLHRPAKRHKHDIDLPFNDPSARMPQCPGISGCNRIM